MPDTLHWLMDLLWPAQDPTFTSLQAFVEVSIVLNLSFTTYGGFRDAAENRTVAELVRIRERSIGEPGRSFQRRFKLKNLQKDAKAEVIARLKPYKPVDLFLDSLGTWFGRIGALLMFPLLFLSAFSPDQAVPTLAAVLFFALASAPVPLLITLLSAYWGYVERRVKVQLMDEFKSVDSFKDDLLT